MSTFTQHEIEEAEKRLLQNVLRVREGNTWVEYGSSSDLRQAIRDAKASMAGSGKPTGSRRVSINSGY